MPATQTFAAGLSSKPSSSPHPEVLMPRRMFALLAGLLLAAFVVAADVPEKAPEKAAPSNDPAKALDQKIMAEAKSKSEIVKNLTYMCDFIGGRLTGSPSLKKANDWTAEVMKSYGL